jgi:hypothetical protein
MGGAVIATLATFSRAAYLGLLSQVLLLGWYSVTAPRGTTRLASRRALAAIVITILLAVTLYDSVARRMSAATVQSTDASVAHRLEVYRIALQLLLERVGAGWGPSGFARGTELEFVIMVIAVSCVKLLSAHNSTQHTSRKHKV